MNDTLIIKVNHPLVGDSTGAYILSPKSMKKVLSTYQGHVDAEGEVRGLIVRATTGENMVADVAIFAPLVNHMYITRNPLVMHTCPRNTVIDGYQPGALIFTDFSVAYQYELMGIPRPPSCVPAGTQEWLCVQAEGWVGGSSY